VSLLPVDGETLRQLYLLGLTTLGQVAALPTGAMLSRFGRQGRTIHRLAGGRDTSPVQPYTPRPTERLARQLDGPVDNLVVLKHVAGQMAETLAARLQAGGHMAREVTLALSLETGGTVTRDLVSAGRATARCTWPACSTNCWGQSRCRAASPGWR
jgi:protein ImuB